MLGKKASIAGRAGRGRRMGVLLIAAGLLGLASAPAAPAADRIFWGNGGTHTISYANLDGSGGGQLNLSGAIASGPRGVAIDSAAGRIYWANQGNDTISYANLDGSGGGGQLNLSGATPNRPHGLAIDPVAGRIYWAEDDDRISYANLDGSGGGGELNLSGAIPAGPYGMAIDPATGRTYWANRDTHTISYANLDGSGGGGELDTSGAPIIKPHGVAVDGAGGRVYWTNLDSTIGYANVDGSGGGGELNLSGASQSGGIGLAIDPTTGRIYWGNLGNDMISYVNLDGSGGGGVLDISGATSLDPRFVALLRAPSGAGAPQIAGRSRADTVLTCSQGNWAPDLLSRFLYRAPQSFAYRWLRNKRMIRGATGSSYKARAAGSYRCRVVATNQAGSTAQTSASLKVREHPKCKKFRKKHKRQRRGLARATTAKKRSHIRANIKHAKKRLKKLGCK